MFVYDIMMTTSKILYWFAIEIHLSLKIFTKIYGFNSSKYQKTKSVIWKGILKIKQIERFHKTKVAAASKLYFSF